MLPTLYSSSILKQIHGLKIESISIHTPLFENTFSSDALVNGCYDQFSDTIFNFETEYNLEAAQKWLTFPGKNHIKFPLQTILPNVQMLRNVEPKRMPRDVEVDRRRRKFVKVRISELLQNAGIPNSELIAPEEVEEEWSKEAFQRKFFISLSVFDDETFDSNSVTGWFNTGLVEGERYPLPAWALVKMSTEDEYCWVMVAVYSYDEDTYLYEVIDLPEGETHHVYRINLMFMAESPYLFLERIKFALNQRKLSEAKIRYQLLIDCALFDGCAHMNQPLLNRIFKMSFVEPLSETNNTPIIHSIANEIRLNFQRVMVSYLFEEFVQRHRDEFEFIEVPPKIPFVARKLPYYSNKRLRGRFEHARGTIRLITLFYVAESIKAMLNAVSECDHIETFCLFTFVYAKALALPDFVTGQESNCSSVVKYLKYVWPENLSGKICLNLRSIGKGWLDLSVNDWNVFNVAKISRFFLQVKFRMQESLQVLLEKSILKFSHLLNDPCLDFLELTDDYEWLHDYRTTTFDRLHLPPVFKLILQIHEDGPFYSTDPRDFEPTLTKLFYVLLMSTCGVRIIDPDSMLNLDFAKNLCISTVELIEDMYIEHDDLLHATYSKALIPLFAYLKKYEIFVEFHELVVDDYIDSFAKAEKSSQEVKNEIIWQKERKEELREILPEQIIIGSFQIIVDPLKKYLIAKRIEIIRKLFLYYIDRMFALNELLLEELLEINGRLHEKLMSIEHLFEIRDYMTLVPDKLAILKERIQIMMMEYSILDSFFYNLNDQQFSMKWEAFAWPHKISIRLIVMKEEHKIDIEEFKRLQIRELASFQERLESLNEEIATFGLQFDPEKVLEVAVDTKKTWKIIEDLQRAGTILQERQILFEAEELSLDYLDCIIVSFSPYRAMWTACSDFVKLEEITIGNPLTTIDLHEIKESLAELKRILEKSAEIFVEKEEVKNVALVFLDKIEKFKPTLVCIECIKNEHWLILHWQEFTQRSGIEIKYTVAMNFAYCMKKGMLNHVPLVVDIAERAVLEADAIRFAMEEEERLRKEAELALLAKKMNRKCRTDIL